MNRDTLYSPKVLIIGIIALIAKYFLDFKLSGSLSVSSYFDHNYFYIVAVLIYIFGYINYKKPLDINK